MQEMREREALVDIVATKVDSGLVFFTHKSSYNRNGEPRDNARDVDQTVPSDGNTSRRIIDGVNLSDYHGTHPYVRVHISNATAGSTPPRRNAPTHNSVGAPNDPTAQPTEGTPLLAPQLSEWPWIVSKLSDLIFANKLFSVILLFVVILLVYVVAMAQKNNDRK
ncbi:transmembrane protein, putative [Bodo saltans]|uniref:Transmembrane protein, putative n=1 Tax=Bodo saltans TaxID=75058 RepID=A0A0S4JET2_BODSA|nr:transmembrane protein, putative [Bodo saltans]|eukprot:CUG87680.1 transmembrane protein, putative [Bodo saltans]